METFETELKNKNRGYLRLIVWQKAMQLFELTHRIASSDPRIDFKLRAQFTDAAQSISANIAEGYGRRSIKEYIQFLYIALGSAAEVFTRAIGLQTIAHITTTRFDEFNRLITRLKTGYYVSSKDWKRSVIEGSGNHASPKQRKRMEIWLSHSNTPPLQHSDQVHA
jgi:four helix bundle protein